MAKWDYAVTKVQEYYGQVVADTQSEATSLVREEIDMAYSPDTEDVILNLYQVDDE